MQKTQITSFIEEDSVSTRRKFGKYLEQVEQDKQRFTITKRGQAVALLVPISDKEAIEDHMQQAQMDKMYDALQSMEGMITDNVSNTSISIDEIVYGQAYDDTQTEANG